MREIGCRPLGRLFCFVLLAVCGISLAALGAAGQGGTTTTTVSDNVYMADGSAAQGSLIITWPAFVTSTTVSVDCGMTPASGCGVEIRMHDYGWGVGNDRNLLGRFSTQAFSLPRLARAQNYFLRLYDSSSPPRYSRYATALHVDYPL